MLPDTNKTAIENPMADARLLSADALTLSCVPEGYQVFVLADLARLSGGRVVLIARDAAMVAQAERALGFIAPELEVLNFPAWDCAPYDSLSPHPAISSARMATLTRLIAPIDKPQIVLTTISAIMQYVPARHILADLSFTASIGQTVNLTDLTNFLMRTGYARCSTVMEPGEFAIRGGIVDIFAPNLAENATQPMRLDFFGDTLESIRCFDAETQRTIEDKDAALSKLTLMAVGEIQLDETAIQHFRRGYVAHFGAVVDTDPLYAAISEKKRYQGMEHWLPLFHEKLESFFDYCGDALYLADNQIEMLRQERQTQIEESYQARKAIFEEEKQSPNSASIMKVLPPDTLYLPSDVWQKLVAAHRWRGLVDFDDPNKNALPMGGVVGRDFAPERQQSGNLFEAVVAHIDAKRTQGKAVLVVANSAGTSDRLQNLLHEAGLQNTAELNNFAMLKAGQVGFADFGLNSGFETDNFVLISEQDILGERLIRRGRRKRAHNFLTEASSLSIGDYVVHVEHGVGRFEGLQVIDVGGAPHDCLKLVYYGDARLFLPVENIELLSRFGGDDMRVQLDKLGGSAWQMRKARLKEKLLAMADKLIEIAAARAMRDGEKMVPEPSLYEGFASRFAYEETDDQLDAIEAVLADMASGRPMDRLICGDVGFGKTEVALRAAFAATMSGKQVAVIAPTTLLTHQHMQSFTARFSGLPIKLYELSRLVSAAQTRQTRKALADGTADIVIGTHALLAKDIAFNRLGLVVIDEEQHFGVAHKERMKELRAQVHILTLTATPIPRTLQMALTGVRDLSLIATPPVDRLAVRTYVAPFDRVGIREALLREKYRAGQSFIIVPRIKDMPEIGGFLQNDVPEVSFIEAHGQMVGSDLENRMTDFYNGRYDVLLSTSIIESGLDIPSANTLIIHHADRFGLAQLYQMRGRVGRSKLRAYAYLTYNKNKILTENAQKRLKVMKSLDSLGAGFTLASHDLDLRGAGNLIGEEQSGHIKEVGYELYQTMLEEAVANQQGRVIDENWAPQINVGISVLIPENYVSDLDLRMGLYKRLGGLHNRAEIDDFGAELIDRFGAMPEEVRHLLDVLVIKIDCLGAGIEKLDVGPRGVAVFFRNKSFTNPAALINYISTHNNRVKLRPDESLVFRLQASSADEKLKAAKNIAAQLVELATS